MVVQWQNSRLITVRSRVQILLAPREKVAKKAVSFKVEQHALENVSKCLNTNIYSYLEISGGQSFNLYLNIVHFFNTSVN